MKASIDGGARATGRRREGRDGAPNFILAALLFLLPGCGGKSTAEWVEQLRAKDSAERLHAIKALGQRGKEADVIVPALAGALRDEDAFVRRDAAEALGRLGASAKAAVPGLQAATRDRNAGVRQEAAKALKRIDPEAAGGAGAGR